MNPVTQCKNLRTKKMYIPALAGETFPPAGAEHGNSCHCWCNCTLTETGPDDRPVGFQVCTPERSCFEH
jgi:hypothetical protein